MKMNRMRVIGLTAAVAVMAVSSSYADAFNDLRYTFSTDGSALGGPSDLTASVIAVTDAANMAVSGTGNNFFIRGDVTDGDTQLLSPSDFDPTDYLSWTLGIDAGSQLDLNVVRFDCYNEMTAEADYAVSFALRSSLDGYASDLAVVENYASSTPQTLAADLDALGATFEGLTGTVGFRIYTYGDEAFNASGERSRLDNIYHTGETSVIPEPATMGLVAVFGGAVLFIRRRFMI